MYISSQAIRLSRSVNWNTNQSTHALLPVAEIGSRRYEALFELFPANRGLILIGKNESFARALWEVGYQLLNLMSQASSQGSSYHAFLLDGTQKLAFEEIGVRTPVAILAI